MWTVTKFLLCSFVVVIAQDEVKSKADLPFLRVQLNDSAALECCYTTKGESLELNWFMNDQAATASDRVIIGDKRESNTYCRTLSFDRAQLSDSGLYRCWLNSSQVFSPGTYLQVYEPREKTINLSENTKNKILTAEGILLLLCVLLPATTLLCQSKRLNELERNKVKKEEENIYQGLNLDDCCSTYDQIERSQAHGPYQDVCNIVEEEEVIQLEKP